MNIFQNSIKNMLKQLYKGEDHRTEVLTLINAEFLDFTVTFLKEIINVKIEGKSLDEGDWYKRYFINDKSLDKNDIATNSGLNMKTITNTYGTSRKEVVLDVSQEHYDVLLDSIQELINVDNTLEIELKLSYKKVSVELTLSETLIVINALAVKRAAIAGGFWSKIGKNIEKPLMESLCALYKVPKENYREISEIEAEVLGREVDYYLVNRKGKELYCEIKMMGKGNPESADAIYARSTDLFIADTLSDLNKRQADAEGLKWIELKTIKDNKSTGELGFRKFPLVLNKLDIPYNLKEDYEITQEDIDEVLNNEDLYESLIDF